MKNIHPIRTESDHKAALRAYDPTATSPLAPCMSGHARPVPTKRAITARHDHSQRIRLSRSQARPRCPCTVQTAGDNKGKERIAIRLDADVLDWYHAQVKGGGNYQTLISDVLRAQ
jgi:uncharacterized protein (DUF4415 family)